jgi:hypothetical protein
MSINIDFAHQKVHEGVGYVANYLETGVANDTAINLSFQTGANQAHIIIDFTSDGKAYFETFSGTTYSNAGTAPDGTKLTSFSRGVVVPPAIATTSTVKYAPTVAVLGTRRGLRLLNGGTGGNSTGSQGGDRLESIIQPNTNLLIRLTNKGGAAKDLGIVLDWYEVDLT